MQSYHGFIDSNYDALLLCEACRIGMLPMLKHRLTDLNATTETIISGSVYVWDETTSGIKRWRDGRCWSASRNVGGFLIYKELDRLRGHSRTDKNNIKSGGLIKKSISVKSSSNHKFHVVGYYSSDDVLSNRLVLPSKDPRMSQVKVPKGLYFCDTSFNQIRQAIMIVQDDERHNGRVTMGLEQERSPITFHHQHAERRVPYYHRPLTPCSPPPILKELAHARNQSKKNSMDLDSILN